MKRTDIRSRIPSEDTRSSGSRIRKYEVQTHWLLQHATTLEENEV
jgi:hypothetical protein